MIRAKVTRWLCSKACQSEIDYPWQNIFDSDNMEKNSTICDTPSDYELVSKKLRRQWIIQHLS